MFEPISQLCPRCNHPAEDHGRLSDLRTGGETVFLRCDCGWHGTREGSDLRSHDEVLPQRDMRG